MVMDIKDITLKYNQEKESTIQYDVFELLQTDLSHCMKKHLRKLNSSNIEKLLSLFPIRNKSQISEVKNLLNTIKEILPKELFSDLKDEVKEICEDYTWIHSKEGEKILQIEQWIKKTRCYLASDYPNAMIYIGRSFINPISLIIGGFVENQNTEELFKKYFNNLRPPINIDYKISLFS
jgi:hypothetical protein